eukprot:2925671-Alexandrium_andersonii.AAC.1
MPTAPMPGMAAPLARAAPRPGRSWRSVPVGRKCRTSTPWQAARGGSTARTALGRAARRYERTHNRDNMRAWQDPD